MTNGSTRKIVGIAFALAVLIAAGQMGGVLGPTSAANETIEGVRTDAALPVSAPASGTWERARAVEVTLSGQPLVAPTRPLPSVPSLSVRVLLNDTHAAFRLSWQDATKDNRTTKDAEFRDAVAILFGPADAPPGPRGPREHPDPTGHDLGVRGVGRRDRRRGFPKVRLVVDLVHGRHGNARAVARPRGRVSPADRDGRRRDASRPTKAAPRGGGRDGGILDARGREPNRTQGEGAGGMT